MSSFWLMLHRAGGLRPVRDDNGGVGTFGKREGQQPLRVEALAYLLENRSHCARLPWASLVGLQQETEERAQVVARSRACQDAVVPWALTPAIGGATCRMDLAVFQLRVAVGLLRIGRHDNSVRRQNAE